MDRARQRFASNSELLAKFNPDLGVMGDREWTDACENPYIQHMAKKMWMHNLTETEVVQINKAVTGYLDVLRIRAQAQPVQPGGQIVRGEIFSIRRVCPDHHGPECQRHWKMNVRDEEKKYAVYTPIPQSILDVWSPEELIGHTVSYYAYLTPSQRDPGFGFAHRPKLMTIYKEKRNAS